VHLERWTAEQFRTRVQDLVDVYVQAMGYPPGVAVARSTLWDEHSRRPDFDCWVALDDTDRVRGLGYGYRGMPGQWWYSEVRRGIQHDDPERLGWLADFFELTELHVRPDTQGSGLGEALLRRLLSARTERHVLLSTPEGENRAWRLYRRLGFQDVLRRYRFSGDARPFGILGRELPLPETGPGRHADPSVG
jgi:ribosomal protein S18 acetylase RimI-like enzyme